jgi:spastin
MKLFYGKLTSFGDYCSLFSTVSRLEKRIYIPLPEAPSRLMLIQHLLRKQGSFHIDEKQMQRVVAATEGYSGSDLAAVCKEAAMGPIRELGAALRTVKAEDVRPLNAIVSQQ